MKSQSVITVGEFPAGTQFLPAPPFLVGKRVLHLVPIFPHRFRTQYFAHRRQLHLGNPGKRILHLPLLPLQLLRIWQMLPFTASAKREMTASRRLPFVGRTDNADYVSFGITALSAVYLYVGHVTRCRIRDKHNHLRFGLRRHPDTAYRLTFGRNTFNLHRLQQRQCFFLS